jgi:hypothetical protein
MTIDQLPPAHWERTGRKTRERSYLLHQLDTNGPRAQGEGLTRTDKPGTRLFAMELAFSAGRPMRTTIRARTWQQAEKFARNRHPDTTTITRLNALPSRPSLSA